MLEKTNGIVLHHFRYGETSVIARVFTREAGLQSFIVPGVRKARARIKQNVFQPLTLVELVIYRKEHGGLQHIREISCPEPWQSIPYDITRTTIAIFLAEMLSGVLKESDPSPGMFDYVKQALVFLDHHSGRIIDFHLVFLLQLSSHLGFSPRSNFDAHHPYFNLREGMYQSSYHGTEPCLDLELSSQFHNLSNCPLEELESLKIKGDQRKVLLHRIIDYYRMHLDGLKEIKSHLVLESVLHE
ncbi:MAG: DNA repair protein RecO [Bacteroidales bacterium]|jgi:DNA repair protein RecO (recombination protein O)|nr:DNA repair protein RecO [Bacteroidales bacterium]NLM92976.1 DNA repair protein RecO [Bacteroidales bacterium]